MESVCIRVQSFVPLPRTFWLLTLSFTLKRAPFIVKSTLIFSISIYETPSRSTILPYTLAIELMSAVKMQKKRVPYNPVGRTKCSIQLTKLRPKVAIRTDRQQQDIAGHIVFATRFHTRYTDAHVDPKFLHRKHNSSMSPQSNTKCMQLSTLTDRSLRTSRTE